MANYLGHVFPYTVYPGDTYDSISTFDYSGLITEEWLMWFNSNRVRTLMVIVNCSCGNTEVSEDCGLFITYPMQAGETLESIASSTNTNSELIQMYNPGVNFSAGSGLLYIPGRDKFGNYPRMPTRPFGHSCGQNQEFSYKELAESTNGFSISNKIGEGGFGTVYYAELRGKITAIKQMNRQAKSEFLLKLKILTCSSPEPGVLGRILCGQGLEYIHEHTVPVCIHRDIKSANILIDKNFHAKVGDFGLTKLVENGNSTIPTRFMGTFGYMSPEYGHSGIISPKIDVYAFGVVLYELISSKEAVVKEDGVDEARSLVALMAQLAKACTEKDHERRPTMRSVVVALMALFIIDGGLII
ncbi:hypothetical protein HAX54_022606 [Datura stramonium]|uniref:Protein kinase domain-containing protein n=1 Tax=Datura stramonium TaxID=4076 RepID=A0ABS8S494_DATST|nr:hypothetical protein [Datura stramonium]